MGKASTTREFLLWARILVLSFIPFLLAGFLFTNIGLAGEKDAKQFSNDEKIISYSKVVSRQDINVYAVICRYWRIHGERKKFIAEAMRIVGATDEEIARALRYHEQAIREFCTKTVSVNWPFSVAESRLEELYKEINERVFGSGEGFYGETYVESIYDALTLHYEEVCKVLDGWMLDTPAGFNSNIQLYAHGNRCGNDTGYGDNFSKPLGGGVGSHGAGTGNAIRQCAMDFSDRVFNNNCDPRAENGGGKKPPPEEPECGPGEIKTPTGCEKKEKDPPLTPICGKNQVLVGNKCVTKVEVNPSNDGLIITGNNPDGTSGTAVCPYSSAFCQVTNTAPDGGSVTGPVPKKIVYGGDTYSGAERICVPFTACARKKNIGNYCPTAEASLNTISGVSFTYSVASVLHGAFPNVPIDDKTPPTAFEIFNQCICGALPEGAKSGFNCFSKADEQRLNCLKSPWGPDDRPICTQLMQADNPRIEDNCPYVYCTGDSLLSSYSSPLLNISASDSSENSNSDGDPKVCACIPIDTLSSTQSNECELATCDEGFYCSDGGCKPIGGSMQLPKNCSPTLQGGGALFAGGLPNCNP